MRYGLNMDEIWGCLYMDEIWGVYILMRYGVFKYWWDMGVLPMDVICVGFTDGWDMHDFDRWMRCVGVFTYGWGMCSFYRWIRYVCFTDRWDIWVLQTDEIFWVLHMGEICEGFQMDEICEVYRWMR